MNGRAELIARQQFAVQAEKLDLILFKKPNRLIAADRKSPATISVILK